MTASRLRALGLLAALALVLGAAAACSDDDSSTSTGGSDDSTQEASGELAVDDVWARATADGQEHGAVYLVVEGGAEDDALIAASVPDDVAAVVELHETVVVDDDSMEGMDDEADHDGMAAGMSMQPVTEVDVPAGGEAVLEPGGYHVMLLELAAPLEVGDTFEVTLTFEEAGELTVPVEVRER